MIYKFPVATDNSFDLSGAINSVLPEIFAQGVRFYRCGVAAIELESRRFQYPNLFTQDNSNPALMQCLDKINQRFGQGALKLGSEGKSEMFQMRSEFLSPQYTSVWKNIPKIHC